MLNKVFIAEVTVNELENTKDERLPPTGRVLANPE